MKDKKIYFIISCIICLIWMVVIFSFSSQPANESSALSGGIVKWILIHIGIDVYNPEKADLVHFMDQFIRKSAHFTEYAIFGALLVNTLKIKDIRHYFGFAWIIGALYATSDEIHQIFVPGRSCQFTDILIDSSGVATGAGIACLIIAHHIKKRRRTEHESMAEEC